MAQPLPTDRDQCLRPTGTWLQVVMHRRGHRWAFRWEPGAEGVLIDHLTNLAAAKDVQFDWFDAIEVSHHVTQESKAALLADFSPTEGAA